MLVKDPFIITPRLQLGARVGDAFLSIDYSDRPGDNGRQRYSYAIDLPGFEHEGDDLQSGVRGGNLSEGFAVLLSFLLAAGEAHAYKERHGVSSDDLRGLDAENFPARVSAWAAGHQDDLAVLAIEAEEGGCADE